MLFILELYKNLLPVIAFIGVGYLLRKKWKLKPSSISTPLLYFLLPVLVIYNVSEAGTSKIVVIPTLTFLVALGMNLPAVLAHKTFAKKENLHLLKGSFTFFNVLFFGIPTVTALFGQNAVSTLILMFLGTAFYGDIISYYQVAKTRFSSGKSVKEVLKIPYVYVFLLAIGVKLLGIEVPEGVAPVMEVLGWIVSAMGMTIVGLNLPSLRFEQLPVLYFTKLLVFRAISAAMVTGPVILAEYLLFQQLNKEDYQILALLPFFPIAASISLFASFLGTKPERFSLLVFFSILFSLLVIPIATLLLNS